MNSTHSSFASALQSAVNKSTEAIQLAQEKVAIDENQRGIANERAERFDQRNRAQFLMEFGRKLARDGQSDYQFGKTFGLAEDKFGEQQRVNLVGEAQTDRRLGQGDTQLDQSQQRIDEGVRQFDAQEPTRQVQRRAAEVRLEGAEEDLENAREDRERKDAERQRAAEIVENFQEPKVRDVVTRFFTGDFLGAADAVKQRQLEDVGDNELAGVVGAAKNSSDPDVLRAASEAAHELRRREDAREGSSGRNVETAGARTLTFAQQQKLASDQAEFREVHNQIRALTNVDNPTDDERKQLLELRRKSVRLSALLRAAGVDTSKTLKDTATLNF